MKKFLIVVLVLTTLYYVRNFIESYQIQKQSLGFVTESLSTISISWSQADFEKYADPSLQKAKGLATTLASYRTFGKLSKPADCSIKDFTSYAYQGTAQKYIAANYLCSAEFEHGHAELQLTIVRYSDVGAWKIEYFHLIPSIAPSQ